MNKAQLIEQLSSETGLTKADTERIIHSTLSNIKDAVKRSEDVTLVGFGTFTRSERQARQARNPQSGELIRVPACSVPKFKAGKAFKECLGK